MIETVEQLEAIYGVASGASISKETNYLTSGYRKFINVSPFVILATSGPGGLDCSPRGDLPGFVRVVDEKTLMLPDRRGNNRIDTLRNIVADPRVGLLFLMPGSGTTFRVNGTAQISDDAELLQSFAVDGKPPRTVLIITVEAAYLQCARAILRSKMWDSDAHVDPAEIPSVGDILDEISNGKEGGKAYDEGWAERAEKTMW